MATGGRDGIPAGDDGVTPAFGCTSCIRGAKMVLFVTGLCDRNCWYCPLSSERNGVDLTYANEHRVGSPQEAIAVARTMNAEGTGVTGGEPLLRFDRVVSYCRALKEEFGNGHHIHLYTGRAPDRETLRAMAGIVDEIRFHPPEQTWALASDSRYIASVMIAREEGLSAGFEVPSLPTIGNLTSSLPFLDFLNINELEWGETNAGGMRARGYEPEDGVHNAVRGAREWAADLVKNPKVRWCSSRFKDSVQLRRRLIRVARNTARPFEEITPDGTVLYGVLEPGNDTIRGLPGRGRYERRDGRIEMSWKYLAGHAPRWKGKKYVVERYPDGGIVVEVTPL